MVQYFVAFFLCTKMKNVNDKADLGNFKGRVWKKRMAPPYFFEGQGRKEVEHFVGK